MGKWIHKLSKVNLEDLTADCAHCGEGITIRMKSINGEKKPRCVIAVNAEARTYQKTYMRKKRYGLLQDEIIDLKKNNPCALCGEADIELLRVDHDHVTGKIRGILCQKCNTGLGKLGDSIESILKVLDYLQNPPLQ